MFKIITIDELLEILKGYNHKELHIHHTFKPAHKDFNGNNAIELQQGMKNYHVSVLGWSDIGQHVTLLPNGLFVTGRDFGKTPASITDHNTGSFACEVLGNFDIGNDVLQGEQKISLLSLAKFFDNKGKYTRFHNENSTKTCPGTSIDKVAFMNEVKTYPKVSVESVVQRKEVKLGNLMVKDFQELCNVLRVATLVTDGIAGPKTTAAVQKLPVIKLGSNIEQAVRVIQQVLGVTADGIFGSRTLAALRLWQLNKDLKNDGIVGPKTWLKMLEVIK